MTRNFMMNRLKIYQSLVIVTVLINCLPFSIQKQSQEEEHHKFLNVWAVKIDGGYDVAQKVAEKYGYELSKQLEGFDNVYIMKKKSLSRRLKRRAIELENFLINDTSVIWAQQQEIAIRVKRGFIDSSKQFSFSLGFSRNSINHKFNDELWPYQWYIHSSGFSKYDHGITKVWEMGYTGKGIVVTILDDGLEWRHSDLFSNYDPQASYDMNDDDNDPTPRYDIHNTNAHGTRCAGEVGMISQNRKCGVGVAFNAKIGGIRCLDGEVSDVLEARALSFQNNYIDIYSSSWGPNDDGLTVDGPKPLTLEALERGVNYGRKGKGSIFIWASGNGGSKGDNCACDGYVSSIYTISIGSVSESGQFAWYGEKCASTLSVAYSSGSYNDKKIATTDIHDSCTTEHSGTSAAAPIAAGIVALVLEANSNLTWRDVQHLIVCTSEFSPLIDNRGWKRNAAGFMYNSRFGFGLLMAHSLVQSALQWKSISEKLSCTVLSDVIMPSRVDDGTVIKVSFGSLSPEKCPIRYLEHVQVKLTLEANRRGNIRVFMFSPHDTLSVLMHPRYKDNSVFGFKNWNLTSVHYWGENPFGIWRLYVQNTKLDGTIAVLKNVELILHGIKDAEGCLREQPHRRYLNEELISRVIDPTPEYFEEVSDNQGYIFLNTFNKLFQ